MESGEVVDGFGKALVAASTEYMQLFKSDLKFIRKTEDRVSACNMCFMRARDILKEEEKSKAVLFTFTITAYNLEQQRWDKCPGCGDPDINQQSITGKAWQGCYKCRVLLSSNGLIKAMDPNRGSKA